MTTKFCTSCQCTREIEGGVYRKTRANGRWICKGCLAHKNESIYMNRSGRTSDVKVLMEKLYRRMA